MKFFLIFLIFIFSFANTFYDIHLALEFTSASKLQGFRQRLLAKNDPREALFTEGNPVGPVGPGWSGWLVRLDPVGPGWTANS